MQVRTTDVFRLVEEELEKYVSGSTGGKKLPVLLAIDGRCGSGKTTLAGMIAQRYRAEVIHMDDFFLQKDQRTPERLAEPGGNVDRERFRQEVILRSGSVRK